MAEQEIDFKYKMHEDAFKFIQELDESNLSYFDKLDKLIEYSKKNMHLLGCHISSYNDNASKEDLAHDFYKIKCACIKHDFYKLRKEKFGIEIPEDDQLHTLDITNTVL